LPRPNRARKLVRRLSRVIQRKNDREPISGPAVAQAQLAATGRNLPESVLRTQTSAIRRSW
jgi:hypothetical protein